MEQQSSSSSVRAILDTQQGKTYTVLIGTILVVLLMFLFAIRPAWISIVDKLAENDVKRTYIEDADQKIADLQNLDNIYQQNILGVNYLNTFLSTSPHESFIYDNLIGLSDRSNVNLSFINFDRPDSLDAEVIISNPGLVSQISLDVLVSSDSLDNLAVFLRELEDSKITFDVTAADYRSLEQDDNVFDGWSMTLKVNYFVWNDFSLDPTLIEEIQ